MSQDFVVIGAGIIGLATALELARRGAKVTVLERGEEGNLRGPVAASCPLCHPGNMLPFNVADSAITCGAALLIWDGLDRRAAK